MRTGLLIVLLIASLSCYDAPTAPSHHDSPTPSQIDDDSVASISFASLAPGDVVQVHFKSIGCFHDYSFQLVFEKDHEGAVVAGENVSGILGVMPSIPSRRLSPVHLAALDRLMSLYRAPSDAMCTTHDSIRVAVSHGSRLIREEQYVDTACVWFDQPGVLSFPRVARGVLP